MITRSPNPQSREKLSTLDAIQQLMRASFGRSIGGWLRGIQHGDLRIVIERGRHTYLALVLKGEESDLMRRQMKDALAYFESENREMLAHWIGRASDAHATEAALAMFFVKETPF